MPEPVSGRMATRDCIRFVADTSGPTSQCPGVENTQPRNYRPAVRAGLALVLYYEHSVGHVFAGGFQVMDADLLVRG